MDLEESHVKTLHNIIAFLYLACAKRCFCFAVSPVVFEVLSVWRVCVCKTA